MADVKYCVCCGEDVPCHSVKRNERIEIICSNCGFPLEIKELWSEDPDRETIAFIAEDSVMVNRVISDVIRQKKYVKKVVSCMNGVELLKAITDIYREKFIEKKDISPCFAIIDLNMPEMDGLTAARSIRALEEKNSIEKIPIIFFTSYVADEKMRSYLTTLSPAVYINKGENPDAQTLIARVNTLLKYINEKYLTKTNAQ